MAKRTFAELDEDEDERTLKRTRNEETAGALTVETPSKQRSILKRTESAANAEGTPRSLRKVLFSTPSTSRHVDALIVESPITAARNADRSARKKSAQKLFDNTNNAHVDEDEAEDEEDALAQEILDQDDDEDETEMLDTIAVVASTPTKTGTPRGRPKGRRRERTPTPPQDMPAHELFFFQNRPGASKTSANTLTSTLLLNHEDYFAQMSSYKDAHDVDKEHLHDLHMRGFDQWMFELQEGFNLCLYGYGSKRELVMDFAEHVHEVSPRPPKMIIVNGYTPTTTLRDILTTLCNTVIPKTQTMKLPAQPVALLDLISSTLATLQDQAIFLVVHSIDAAPLRKAPVQAAFARLASLPGIGLIATADTPNFPLMWDITLRTSYHFLFHDTTTFAPFAVEVDVVDEVNALLGRSGRRVGGKDGVSYVLRSLPENARSLFRILVAEQLALADSGGVSLPSGNNSDSDEDDLLGFNDDGRNDMDLDEPDPATPSRVRRGRPAKARPKPRAPKQAPNAAEGVEYRTLYHKAVEEFVCSSEMGFRTLLKEFHDHAMIESRKDGVGTERLSVPFAREDMEALLEELV